MIRRYQGRWAIDEIAKTVARGRRKGAYAHRVASPPPRYAYNAANSAKRNPAAPRGRWDSVSQSVIHKSKGKKVQRAEEQTQDVRVASPALSNQGSVNTADVRLALSSPVDVRLDHSHHKAVP